MAPPTSGVAVRVSVALSGPDRANWLKRTRMDQSGGDYVRNILRWYWAVEDAELTLVPAAQAPDALTAALEVAAGEVGKDREKEAAEKRVQTEGIGVGPDTRSEDEKRIAYIMALRQVFGQDLAAEKAGVSIVEVDGWIKDPVDGEVFRAACERARGMYGERIEHHMALLGMGARDSEGKKIEGNASCLAKWLEGNMPNHGLVKQGYLRRLLDGVLGKVQTALEAELPKNEHGRDVLQRIGRKMKQLADEAVGKLPE